MSRKPALSIPDQIALLESRGLSFGNKAEAELILERISYYRLKGYWWDMQDDYTNHTFRSNSTFETVLARYDFDRQLRVILFEAIEIIEVALRTKMIYYLSMKAGSNGLWYLDPSLFDAKKDKNGVLFHDKIIGDLRAEFSRSGDEFAKDHKQRFPGQDSDSWKIIEVTSFGTLSKIYSTLVHNLPEKAKIANSMGLNLSKELSSWVESIAYVRNIIAHHSRLWNRDMAKTPIENINNPKGHWFASPLVKAQKEKPFLIISCMLYLCDAISPDHQIKVQLLQLINTYPKDVYKLGFLNTWRNEPLWK